LIYDLINGVSKNTLSISSFFHQTLFFHSEKNEDFHIDISCCALKNLKEIPFNTLVEHDYEHDCILNAGQPF